MTEKLFIRTNISQGHIRSQLAQAYPTTQTAQGGYGESCAFGSSLWFQRTVSREAKFSGTPHHRYYSYHSAVSPNKVMILYFVNCISCVVSV